MNTLEFTIYVEPRSQQAGSRATMQGGKLRFYRDSKKRSYFNEVKLESAHLLPPHPLEGPLEVHMIFHLARPDVTTSQFKMLPAVVKEELLSTDGPVKAWSHASNKGDGTNIFKVSMDALAEAGLVRNDAQLWKESSESWWTSSDLPPRIQVKVIHQDQPDKPTTKPKKK